MQLACWCTTVGPPFCQVDEFESEVEGLASTKRGKKPPPRLAHFEESIARHKQHVLRLEQMLRLLDNESLSVEEVTETRDMVDDYLERNQVLVLLHCAMPRPLPGTLFIQVATCTCHQPINLPALPSNL